MNRMMDLKEIIKWFIPCFHILLYKKVKMLKLAHVFCLFLLFFARPSCAKVDSFSDANAKDVINYNNYLDNNNQSDYVGVNVQINERRNLDVDTSVARTFGRPAKMLQAIVPLVWQMGAASTWMVVAAVVGVKTLLVALVILKLLLIAGAAKLGALFGSKSHGWEPHPQQKEIHLHIHGAGQQGIHEEHLSPWSRDGATATAETKNINLVLNPYASGPQTISTPFGNYVRVDSPQVYNPGLTNT